MYGITVRTPWSYIFYVLWHSSRICLSIFTFYDKSKCQGALPQINLVRLRG